MARKRKQEATDEQPPQKKQRTTNQKIVLVDDIWSQILSFLETDHLFFSDIVLTSKQFHRVIWKYPSIWQNYQILIPLHREKTEFGNFDAFLRACSMCANIEVVFYFLGDTAPNVPEWFAQDVVPRLQRATSLKLQRAIDLSLFSKLPKLCAVDLCYLDKDHYNYENTFSHFPHLKELRVRERSLSLTVPPALVFLKISCNNLRLVEKLEECQQLATLKIQVQDLDGKLLSRIGTMPSITKLKLQVSSWPAVQFTPKFNLTSLHVYSQSSESFLTLLTESLIELIINGPASTSICTKIVNTCKHLEIMEIGDCVNDELQLLSESLDTAPPETTPGLDLLFSLQHVTLLTIIWPMSLENICVAAKLPNLEDLIILLNDTTTKETLNTLCASATPNFQLGSLTVMGSCTVDWLRLVHAYFPAIDELDVASMITTLPLQQLCTRLAVFENLETLSLQFTGDVPESLPLNPRVKSIQVSLYVLSMDILKYYVLAAFPNAVLESAFFSFHTPHEMSFTRTLRSIADKNRHVWKPLFRIALLQMNKITCSEEQKKHFIDMATKEIQAGSTTLTENIIRQYLEKAKAYIQNYKAQA